jgi:hypothetical protein
MKETAPVKLCPACKNVVSVKACECPNFSCTFTFPTATKAVDEGSNATKKLGRMVVRDDNITTFPSTVVKPETGAGSAENTDSLAGKNSAEFRIKKILSTVREFLDRLHPSFNL